MAKIVLWALLVWRYHMIELAAYQISFVSASCSHQPHIYEKTHQLLSCTQTRCASVRRWKGKHTSQLLICILSYSAEEIQLARAARLVPIHMWQQLRPILMHNNAWKALRWHCIIHQTQVFKKVEQTSPQQIPDWDSQWESTFSSWKVINVFRPSGELSTQSRDEPLCQSGFACSFLSLSHSRILVLSRLNITQWSMLELVIFMSWLFSQRSLASQKARMLMSSLGHCCSRLKPKFWENYRHEYGSRNATVYILEHILIRLWLQLLPSCIVKWGPIADFLTQHKVQQEVDVMTCIYLATVW